MSITGQGYSDFANDLDPDVLETLFPDVYAAQKAAQQHLDAGGSKETMPSWNDWAKYELTMGSVTAPYGFCSQTTPLSFPGGTTTGNVTAPRKYGPSTGAQIPAKMKICSCQNASINRPGCNSAACNTQLSYKPEEVINQILHGNQQCPPLTVNDCSQVLNNVGNNNNVQATMNLNCQGTQNFFTTNIKERPYSAVALCVMVIAIILLGLSLRPKPSTASRLPPPESMLLVDSAVATTPP